MQDSAILLNQFFERKFRTRISLSRIFLRYLHLKIDNREFDLSTKTEKRSGLFSVIQWPSLVVCNIIRNNPLNIINVFFNIKNFERCNKIIK